MTTRTTWAAALALIGIVFVLHAWHLECVAEDSYITFRYGRHLAEGHGFVWNIGEAPVEGFTTFLWVLASSAIYVVNLPMGLSHQVLGVVAGLGVLMYTTMFCRRLVRASWPVSLIPALALALSGPFASWATSGMETSLFTFFVTAACYHEAASWLSPETKHHPKSMLFLFAATLTRPEGFGVFCILLIARIVVTRELRRTLIVSLLYLVPFTIYVAWRYSYFGYLLPNTFYAKTGGATDQWSRGLTYVRVFGIHYLLPWVPLAIFAVIRGWRRSNGVRVVAAPLAVCAGYTAYIVYVGGDYMAMYRFFVPLLPLFYLLVAYACHRATSASTRRATIALWILVSAACAATLLPSTRLDEHLPEATGTLGLRLGVDIERWSVANKQLYGAYLAKVARRDDTLATEDIGIIPYVSQLRTFDFYGLVDPIIAHRDIERMGAGIAGHEKYEVLYILGKKPTYVVLGTALFANDEPLPLDEHPPEVRRILETEYDPVIVPATRSPSDDVRCFPKFGCRTGYLKLYRRKL